MDNAFGGTFVGLLFVVWVAVLILPTIFFILTQQRALSKCSPRNQTMSPGLVWLQIIPFFGFIWQFFVVSALANSLGSEFRSRGILEEGKPGQGVGLAMCITRVCVIIPMLGILSLIASVILWIIYWVKIAGFSRKLDRSPAVSYSAPSGPGYLNPYAVGGSPYPAPGLQPPAYGAAPAVGAPVTRESIAPAAEMALTRQTAAWAPSSCPTCGASMAGDAAFCTSCGTKAEQKLDQSGPAIKKCANCEAMLPADATFCAWCGVTMDGSSS